GPGGKIIQSIQEESKALVSLEEVDGGGLIEVSACNAESVEIALARIKAIVCIPEIGEDYDAKVKAIQPYGAFVEFLPGKEGLLHISEIAWRRLEGMEDSGLKEGDVVRVRLLDIDRRTGKFKLSMKALLPRPERREE
ncbi:MAG TPA: polyribonucleotide nucleotidyltransferase, partial [Porphyromonadaceae bacterium]|nr:polyribonucleotide nucleotidyltransferase [Porphyromonadaceae bacterium]